MKINNGQKELDLSYSDLEEIPIEVFSNSSLETLILRGNKIKKIPDKISLLKNLQDLDLSNNSVSEISKKIGGLTKLKLLDLDNNNLKKIPDEVFMLQSLRGLFINNNSLVEVPNIISELNNLEYFSLKDNKIETIPYSMGKLKNLKGLELKGNPLDNPPLEVIEKGTDFVLNYLRQIAEEGIDYLYEAKLIIIGEGGAGKTTLAEKIKNQNYKLKDEDSTRGIEVSEWNFEVSKKDVNRNFKVNVWDFGGQEIYHATHQFFLTQRSLYTLVADTRKEDTDFNYWLNVVELLSDNSPIIIVLNEKQDRKKKLNESKLKSQFNNLLTISTTNLATKRGLADLIDDFKHYICKLPHIGSELPKSWTKIRKILEQDERNYIDLKEYVTICKKNGVSTFEKSMNLSGYYHDLGVFLHFRGNPILKNTIILKPKWATEAVYKLIDSNLLIENNGQFSKIEIKKIWHNEEYLMMQEELLELMKKFEVCYQLRESSKFIIPQLLQANSPDYIWDDVKNLQLKYTYQFMPKGIINRLIVRLHRYIDDQNLVWKEGVILNREDTTAEIIEDYSTKEISIKVTGKRKRDLLIIISEELDQINESYHKRLKVEKMIPCNCPVCKNNLNPYFYRLESLRRRIENGKKTIECDISYEDVNVKSLIDDIVSQPLTKKELKQLIAQGETEKVLETIKKNLDNKDKFYNEIILQLNRLYSHDKKKMLGIERSETLTVERNNLEFSIIQLIDQINLLK